MISRPQAPGKDMVSGAGWEIGAWEGWEMGVWEGWETGAWEGWETGACQRLGREMHTSAQASVNGVGNLKLKGVTMAIPLVGGNHGAEGLGAGFGTARSACWSRCLRKGVRLSWAGV